MPTEILNEDDKKFFLLTFHSHGFINVLYGFKCPGR